MVLLDLESREATAAILIKLAGAAGCTRVRAFTLDYDQQGLKETGHADAEGEKQPGKAVPMQAFELVRTTGQALVLEAGENTHAGEAYALLDEDNGIEIYVPLKSALDGGQTVYGLVLLESVAMLSAEEVLSNPTVIGLIGELNCRLSVEDGAARYMDGMRQAAYMLCEMADMNEPHLINRTLDVARWSGRIARNMGLGREDAAKLEVAALMHDLGKVFIEEGIRNKSEKLTAQEQAAMKRRPVLSCEIVRKLDPLSMMGDLPEVILSIRERVDGRGFPAGKKEEEIPLLSRILSVAQAIAAMLTNTTTHKGRSIPGVISELKTQSGRLYDRNVVRAAAEALAKAGKDGEDYFEGLGTIASLSMTYRDADQDGKAQKSEQERASIWGRLYRTGEGYAFEPVGRTYDLKTMRIQNCTLYVSESEKMCRYKPEGGRTEEGRIVFPNMRVEEETGAFAISWLLEGQMVSTSKQVYNIFVTLVSGEFVDFYIFTNDIHENIVQGIVRVAFEEENFVTLPGMVVFTRSAGDKTYFRMKFMGLREAEKQVIFSKILKRQIEMRAKLKEADDWDDYA
jgi:HD-GYP domain-containing protein (c-di-GMP phosphodiesterase class II)